MPLLEVNFLGVSAHALLGKGKKIKQSNLLLLRTEGKGKYWIVTSHVKGEKLQIRPMKIHVKLRSHASKLNTQHNLF